MSVHQPQPAELGHDAALDLGVSALESGLTALAISYLDHAAALRPTRFGLIQLAKAHRDLGQLEAAQNRLDEARQLPDGKDPYVLVSLAAVLCDRRDYGLALETAMEAVEIDYDNSAALSIAARCMNELAATLEQSPNIDTSRLAEVREQAVALARRAADAQPESIPKLVERRRRRATQAWLAPATTTARPVPIEQSPATVLRSSTGAVEVESSADTKAKPETPSTAVSSTAVKDASVWQRGWRRLRLLLGRH